MGGGVGSVRVQLWRRRDLDRDGWWAYGWRTTRIRGSGHRSWSDGVLMAHPRRGVTWLGPDIEGLTTAMAVLADERRRTGMLPGRVDRWIDDPPAATDAAEARMPGAKRSRYDRYGPGHETIAQRAARERREQREAQRRDDG